MLLYLNGPYTGVFDHRISSEFDKSIFILNMHTFQFFGEANIRRPEEDKYLPIFFSYCKIKEANITTFFTNIRFVSVYVSARETKL